jgi:hypothetical protein
MGCVEEGRRRRRKRSRIHPWSIPPAPASLDFSTLVVWWELTADPMDFSFFFQKIGTNCDLGAIYLLYLVLVTNHTTGYLDSLCPSDLSDIQVINFLVVHVTIFFFGLSWQSATLYKFSGLVL